MTEDDDDSALQWDEVVDVVCIGASPGVLAYAICCAANDLDVLLIGSPAEPDPQTADWYAAMTEDLGASTLHAGRGITPEIRPGFSFARVTPPAAATGKRVTLEPFIGQRLRQWSAHCLRSPFGMMFTQVPELLIPMRTDCGESLTAAVVGDLGDSDLLTWLAERGQEYGLTDPENVMAAMLYEEGRIAGVELDGGYRVAATGGLVFGPGPQSSGPQYPGPDRPDCRVAVVGRPAGRFATVDLLAP